MKASILIPTKNGEEYLEEVLQMVFKQKAVFANKESKENASFPFDFEVIIVDSGSKDGTLEIVRKFQKLSSCHSERSEESRNFYNSDDDEILRYAQDDKGNRQDEKKCAPQLRSGGSLKGVKLYQIPPQEFGHGKTRDFAVSKAQGEYFVFLTQDATPADENWLKNMVEAFEKDPQIAGVFGRHFPRKECDPFQKKMLIEYFPNEFGKELTIFQLSDENKQEEFEKNKGKLIYFSNVNSAIRRAVWKKIPFQEVEMGEDQFWAKDIILAGYKKAYQPDAAVYHSHNYPIKSWFKRWFDEYRQHKINQNYVGVSTVFKIPFLTLRLWINDVRYIKSRKEYNFFQKIYWSIWIFFMDLARFCAEYLGARYEKLPKWMQKRFSMQYELINR